MGDGHRPDSLRFAIIRFRSLDDPRRLRLLLRQHGFDEPIWLDAHGQTSSPPALIAAGTCSEQLQADSAPDLAGPSTSRPPPVLRSQSDVANESTPSTSRLQQRLQAPVAPFLRLPTVLVDGSTGHSLQAQTSAPSAVLPLASALSSPSLSSQFTTIPPTAQQSPSDSTPSTTPHENAPSLSPSIPPPILERQSTVEEPRPSVISKKSIGIEIGAGAAAEASTSAVGSVASVSRAWVSPAPLRPRGKKPHVVEDPNVYYVCQICKNKILGTRVSNLQNHVRRHSTLKQFQCCYCEYAHNEIAKVRLHMTNNHKDSESPPVNNLTTDMQGIWSALFRECFPTRAQRRRGMRATPAANNPGPSGATSSSSTTRSSSTTQSTSTSRANFSQSAPGPSGLQYQRSSTSSASSSTIQSSSQHARIPLSKRRRRCLINKRLQRQQQQKQKQKKNKFCSKIILAIKTRKNNLRGKRGDGDAFRILNSIAHLTKSKFIPRGGTSNIFVLIFTLLWLYENRKFLSESQ